jgi:hypothetical protein
MKKIVLGLVLMGFSVAAHANWTFTKASDPMTDEDRSYATVDVGPKHLYVLCVGASRYQIAVKVREYMGSAKSYAVSYRLDNQPVVNASRWKVAPNGATLFVPDDISDRFLESLKTASRITIQATAFDGPETAVFSLAGSSSAISKLKCLQ